MAMVSASRGPELWIYPTKKAEDALILATINGYSRPPGIVLGKSLDLR